MWIRSIVDNTDQASVASKLRRKRFDLFLNLIEDLPRPVRILDVGGRLAYWKTVGFTGANELDVTLLNIEDLSDDEAYPNFRNINGDARRMPQYTDNSFDVVFSNSVIEHVGNYEDQKAMAQEVQRVGVHYYVQTPNYHFPMEPHFLVPFFHMMHPELRARLHTHFNLGWEKKAGNLIKARENISYIRLLKKHEFVALFPDAHLYEEKVAGMTKSFVAYR